MSELVNKIGTFEQDNLIARLSPAAETMGIVIRKLGTAATLKRGTILARSSGSAGDGKYVILGTSAASNETLTPAAILCDDVDVGTAADAKAIAYRCGNFNPGALIVATGYTLSADDIDTLRKYDIILTQMI